MIDGIGDKDKDQSKAQEQEQQLPDKIERVQEIKVTKAQAAEHILDRIASLRAMTERLGVDAGRLAELYDLAKKFGLEI